MDYYLQRIFIKLFNWHTPQLFLMILVAVIVVVFVCVNVLFLIWLERKVSARIQNRMGPMLHGPKFLAKISMWSGGIFQTVWDTVKLLLKEQITPAKADKLIFFTAPFVVFTACFLTYLVIPFGPNLIVKDLNLGLLYLFAVSAFTMIAILMAGWGSNNKYSLLGGFRSAAQIMSYEVPLIFSLLGVVVLSGSLKMGDIVEAQKNMWFIAPQIFGFIIYIIAAVAELNRPPFDIPEAESELVAGFNIEYSGMGFAMFFLSEFANVFVASAIAVTLFFGGWMLPFGWQLPPALTVLGFTLPYFNLIGSAFIFLVKTYFIIFIIMWIRWTFPRLRSDQLMGLGWKVLLPIAFLNLIGTCLFLIIRG